MTDKNLLILGDIGPDASRFQSRAAELGFASTLREVDNACSLVESEAGSFDAIIANAGAIRAADGIRASWVINGPNLNLLGMRETEIYGSDTLRDISERCTARARESNIEVRFLQSNHEGEIVDWIQDAVSEVDAIVINAAAYTHTSVAIHDALQVYPGLKVELHISNPYTREDFRHRSFVSSAVDAVFAGLGTADYDLVTDLICEGADVG